jgi:MurNAc alpha-1-phosphate uridylyltransferase
MKALILAAGRGERMRPLTDTTPKPLIEVRGRRLIDWHLEALARAGVREVVVNTAWLEEQFPAALGDGSRHGLHITYSPEGRDHGGALETAGGIAKALPLLGDAFWVVSGDVFVPDFAFDPDDARRFADGDALGRLWLVDNAPHHPNGDFGIDAQGLASRGTEPKFTWASIGLFRAALFQDIAVGTKMALRPKLEFAIDERRLLASKYDGRWTDVGTMERLASLNTTP